MNIIFFKNSSKINIKEKEENHKEKLAERSYVRYREFGEPKYSIFEYTVKT